MDKKLMRSKDNEQLAGVAAGLANYFDIDVTIVRLLFVLFTLMGGPGVLAYIVLAIIMPAGDSVVGKQINIEKGPVPA
ncbi:MAG: PspC domain-containing protein [Anaerolineae bacterium]